MVVVGGGGSILSGSALGFRALVPVLLHSLSVRWIVRSVSPSNASSLCRAHTDTEYILLKVHTRARRDTILFHISDESTTVLF